MDPRVALCSIFKCHLSPTFLDLVDPHRFQCEKACSLARAHQAARRTHAAASASLARRTRYPKSCKYHPHGNPPLPLGVEINPCKFLPLVRELYRIYLGSRCALRLTPLLHRPLSEPLQVVQSRHLHGAKRNEWETRSARRGCLPSKKRALQSAAGGSQALEKGKRRLHHFCSWRGRSGGHFSTASILNGIG